MTKLAVIGAGEWGLKHIRVLCELDALGAICEIDRQRIENVSRLYPKVPVVSSLDQVIREPDLRAVVIATPPETHHRIAKECLFNGKDVLVEKPLALRVEEGEELVRIASQQGRVLMVGHLLQYHPAFVRLKALVESGELGEIQYIYSSRLNFGKIRVVENILWSFAPHDISMMLALLRQMPEEVAAHGASYLNDSIADVTVTNLKFRSGVQAHIFVSWLHPFKEQKLVVVGDRKMAVFNDTVQEDKLVVYSHKVNWIDRIPTAQKAEAERVLIPMKEPLQEECRHFLECIETRRSPRTDGEEGLGVLEVLSACQQSLERHGEKVRLHALPLKNTESLRSSAATSTFATDAIGSTGTGQ